MIYIIIYNSLRLSAAILNLTSLLAMSVLTTRQIVVKGDCLSSNKVAVTLCTGTNGINLHVQVSRKQLQRDTKIVSSSGGHAQKGCGRMGTRLT